MVILLKIRGKQSWNVCVCFRFGETSDPGMTRHEGRGSEGFLEHVFKHAAKELFGLDVQEIVYKTLRWETDQSVSDHLYQHFPIPVLAQLCIFCMSLLVNKPDSDNQLVRRELRAWTVFRLIWSIHSVHCFLFPEQGKSVEVYFTPKH